MNTETGVLYRSLDAIADALSRGESVVPVSERVVRTMRAGQRVEAKATAKRKRKQARQDRKRNRGQ